MGIAAGTYELDLHLLAVRASFFENEVTEDGLIGAQFFQMINKMIFQ